MRPLIDGAVGVGAGVGAGRVGGGRERRAEHDEAETDQCRRRRRDADATADLVADDGRATHQLRPRTAVHACFQVAADRIEPAIFDEPSGNIPEKFWGLARRIGAGFGAVTAVA